MLASIGSGTMSTGSSGNVEAAKTNAIVDLPDLPLEIIRKIAMHLADLGHRSAVTAALLHPSFKQEALDYLLKHGTVLSIKTEYSMTEWVEKCKAIKAQRRPCPLVHTLRFTASSKEEFHSRKAVWPIGIAKVTENKQRYKCDSLEMPGNLEDGFRNKAFWDIMRDTRLLYLTIYRMRSYTYMHYRSQLDVPELTLIEGMYPGHFTSSLHLFKMAKQILIFYLDDQIASNRRLEAVGIVKRLASRLATASDDHPVCISTILHTPSAAKFYFVAIKPKRRVKYVDDVKVVLTGQYGEKVYFLRYYYDGVWQEKDLDILFEEVHKMRQDVKKLMGIKPISKQL